MIQANKYLNIQSPYEVRSNTISMPIEKYSENIFPNTSNATGEFQFDIITPTEQSGAAEWIAFFDKLDTEFGAENAAMIWTQFFNKGGNKDFISDKDFVSEMNSRGIDLKAGRGEMAKIGDIASGLFENILGVASSSAAVLKYGIPVIAIAGVLVLGFLAYGIGSGKTKLPAVV